MSKKTLNLIIFCVVLVIGVGFWAWYDTRSVVSGRYDSFAKCLAEKKITMYGAYWCPHCQEEKRAFGDSWKYVPYVECTEDIQKCTDAKIDGYPTWIFPDGKRLEGKQGLDKLSQESLCPLP